MVDIAHAVHHAVGVIEESVAREPIAECALHEEDPEQNRNVRRGGRCDARRRLAKIQRPAHPVNPHPHRGGEKQDHQEQVAQTLQQRQREDVESDIMPEGTIADVKRHPIDRLQVHVPSAGFAIGGKNREDRGDDHHQQAPWNPIAERANQLGQIDLGHLVGTPHHPQPLAIAVLSNREEAAGGNRDERYQPYRRRKSRPARRRCGRRRRDSRAS